jgi:hypothetical protein
LSPDLLAPVTGPAPLASPLTLLLEAERDFGRTMHEALFLSFTADLGFFESVALGVAQATGARVTVVSDVEMVHHDPRAVRRAGRSYLPGLAAADGAFHPKLVILAGPERATIAIGSGNTTLAGWQQNCELWTVLRSTKDQSPSAVGDLSAWLRDVPAKVTFSAGIQEALQRVAALLDHVSDSAEPIASQVRLVSSLNQPILDQLPHSLMDELAVFAPFHDDKCAAVLALQRRFTPKRFTVAYQHLKTDLNGPALAALVEERRGQLVVDRGNRYRHGKLVEWTTGGQRWALTGSANLSRRGLLTSQGRGANCELGLIAPIKQTLMPEAEVGDLEELRTAVKIPRPRISTGRPLLLGAVRTVDGIEVRVARAFTVAGYLQLSPAFAPPEVWERVGDVPAGVSVVNATSPAEGGSRIRLVIETDGVPVYGEPVPVVDLERSIRRPAGVQSIRPSVQIFDLFRDPRLAERFAADQQTLRGIVGKRPAVLAVNGRVPGRLDVGADASLDTGTADWEKYLDECAGRLGQPLLRFALGLPSISVVADVPFEDLVPVTWDEEATDDSEASLENDDPSEVAEETPIVSVSEVKLPDLSKEPEEVRRRYRNWIYRLVRQLELAEDKDLLGPVEAMLAVRLTLWTVAAGAWPANDLGWVPTLAAATRALAYVTVDRSVEPTIASLAAVSTAVLRAHAPRTPVTAETVEFKKTADAVEHLLPAAELDYVDEFTWLLQDAFGLRLDAARVLDLAEEIVQDDPIAQAERALEAAGHKVVRHTNQLLQVVGRFSNPSLVALEAVGAAEDAPLVGAWAVSTSHEDMWALVIWRRPDLIRIDTWSKKQLWHHYRLTGPMVGVSALARSRSFQAAARIAHGPANRSFNEAINLLAELGLSSPNPPVKGKG